MRVQIINSPNILDHPEKKKAAKLYKKIRYQFEKSVEYKDEIKRLEGGNKTNVKQTELF